MLKSKTEKDADWKEEGKFQCSSQELAGRDVIMLQGASKVPCTGSGDP